MSGVDGVWSPTVLAEQWRGQVMQGMSGASPRLRAAVVAPHAAAADAGAGVLAEGGNAVEAMVAAAAAIAVVYPHMNSLGGDGFWLIQEPDGRTQGIDASGVAAARADAGELRAQGCSRIPHRGPLAANTVAGTVAGWEQALAFSADRLQGRMPISRLLAPAIAMARDGIPATRGHAGTLADKLDELVDQPGFATTFLIDGRVPQAGERVTQPQLADTLQRLAEAGPADFYTGDLAATMAAALEAAGSPIRLDDLRRFRVRTVSPLSLSTPAARLLNFPPPTQGLASLLILGLYQRILQRHPHASESAGQVHALVEATKLAFRVRDHVITDPERVPVEPAAFLDQRWLDRALAGFDPDRAAPWPDPRPVHPPGGDTVWLGAVDAAGCKVSFIQSTYHEFGSGVVAGATGIVWQNRGCSFSLEPGHLNLLEPGRRPFHTLNPALANTTDGRSVVYGTMGGEGQPQTQAAVFSRAILHGLAPDRAVAAPRWLLGRTWGSGNDNLKLEQDTDPAVVQGLRERGHALELVPACNAMMGHAGLLIVDSDGHGVRGASDPRCDGAVVGVDAAGRVVRPA